MEKQKTQYIVVSIDKIDEPEAPARADPYTEDIQELAESIRELGLLNPITLKKKGDRYEIVAGHRRYLAVKLLGWTEIPAQVVEAEQHSYSSMMLAENLVRKNLSPVEEACMIQDILERGEETINSLAQALGKHRQWITKRLAILEWPTDIQKALHEGLISYAVAEYLAQIDDDDTRLRYLKTAIEKKISAETAKMWLDLYESSKEIPGFELDPAEIQHEKVDYTKVTLKCQICEQEIFPVFARSIVVCADCLKEIFKIKALLKAGVSEEEIWERLQK